MEEEKKINTDELKEETKETFNKVKSEIKDANFKEETVKATNFVKEMVMNPIEAIKNVAQGNGAKLATIIMIVIGLLISNVAYEIISLFSYSYGTLGDKLWDIITAITEPLFLLLVPSLIIFLFNKNKKSLLTTLSTMVVAYVPAIFSNVVSIVYLLISQLSLITSPINAGLGVAQTILTYFGMKTLMEEEDESFIVKFVIIEVVVGFVMIILRRLNVC